jgi:hypothetical protein
MTALLCPSAASAHPQQPVLPLRPESAIVTDSQHAQIAVATVWRGNVLVSSTDLHGRIPAWLCFAPGSCMPIQSVTACEQMQSPVVGCEQGLLLLMLRNTTAPPPPPPPPPPTVLFDPCDSTPVPATISAAAVTIGPEAARLDGMAQLGFTISPGYRRLIAPNRPPTADGCFAPTPPIARLRGGPWLGSEYGFDVRAHVLWSLPASTSAVSAIVGIAPIGRLLVANGRLRIPSILGLIVPEVGYRLVTRKYDGTGALLSHPVSEWSLFFRPAGMSIGVVLAREPLLSIDLNVAPWIEVPLSGQQWTMGMSASALLSAAAW